MESPPKPVAATLLLAALALLGWVGLAPPTPASRRVFRVALSRSGRWLAAGTAQGRIAVWDLAGGAPPRHFAFPHGPLNDLHFSPDERLLAIASRDLALYAPAEPSPPRILRSDRANYGSAGFSPDSNTLLVTTGSGILQTFDLTSGTPRLRLCCSSVYGEAAFTPDGAAIANAGHWPGLWDARSGKLTARLTASRQFETFGPIAFDAPRDAILMGSQDGRVYLWNLGSRHLDAVSSAQPGYVETLAVSPAGLVIYAAFGKSVEVWDPATGVRRGLPDARPAGNLVIGPGGVSVLFGTPDGRVEFRDIASGQRRRELRLP